jgi:hypothetical protein
METAQRERRPAAVSRKVTVDHTLPRLAADIT